MKTPQITTITGSAAALASVFTLVISGISLFLLSTPQAAQAAPANASLGKYYVLVTPDSYNKQRGGWVMFSGSHFLPNEPVSIKQNGVPVDPATADANGNFITKRYQLPFTDSKVPFVFKGTLSGLSFTVNETVSGASPWVTLSSYYAGSGSLITISGHSFAKNEPVEIWFYGINLGSVQADDAGNFSKPLVIPAGGPGKRMIQASGILSRLSASQTLSQAW